MKLAHILSPLANLCLLAQISAAADDFTNNIVFKPSDDYTSWKTIYGRSVQLQDGSLLVTWEDYSPEPPLAHFPIWKSVDNGVTWFEFVNVTDQLGDYKAGTLILSGMSLPADLSEAWLDMYTSTDGGESWEFASHVVYAPGPETTKNGDKAVWEPFLLMHNGELVCYYSDQRDESHAQKLSHIVTKDLKSWSDPVDDVAHSEYKHRPGMTTVAHIESVDKYIMTFELCDGPDGGCPSYFKVSSSPYDFGSAEEHKILSNDTDTNPGSSPFVIWTPHPERDDGSGLVIMNGSGREEVFINEDTAEPDGWKMVDVKQWTSHSRCLEIINVEGEKKLMITGAGHMSKDTDNLVAVGVVGIPT
ncbi:bnr asp-box repeat domain [Fusarium albosuccineum]|uniref:Bnr asp-box repeat domain n=1 Tax=Fusarium albosuccineum TaxID=1237068 RepID=A0A8H4P251_9HYPO|nr:bnr asp-box repeat domain [Fusarium albosuccineum]